MTQLTVEIETIKEEYNDYDSKVLIKRYFDILKMSNLINEDCNSYKYKILVKTYADAAKLLIDGGIYEQI